MRDTNNANAKLNTPLEFVETPEALKRLAAQLLQAPRVAVDTESNSLHAYREQVCLIQFSIPEGDYLVDPLALDDLSPLAPFFASPEIEKVFHAADYDLIVLQRDFDFTCGKLFDTMWAGRVLGWAHVGLADVLKAHFDVHLNKKYQRHDWGRRPLSRKALAYARMDTHYLLPLRDLQEAELRAAGHWEEAQEIFDYLRTHVPQPSPPNPKADFWQLKGLHKLNVREKCVLYRLHLWRERTAQKLDRPPFKVIDRRRLLSLARVHPRSYKGLRAAGLTKYQTRRFGKGILKALHAQAQALPPMPPESPPPPAEVQDRYDALHAWRKEVARARGVDSDVILPNATLWALAWDPPTTEAALLEVPGIGPWRQQAYGTDLLALLSS
ncbi:MAG: ribonuclease D [Anaerolineae bacterium]